LWPEESSDLNYLYVLENAGNKARNTELQDRALSRFVELGQNSAEYHLLMGKAFLNREENDQALAELEQAAQSDPNLPLVHFNLGLAYLVRLDFDHAKEEFEKDIALNQTLLSTTTDWAAVTFISSRTIKQKKTSARRCALILTWRVRILVWRACTSGKSDLIRP
jgi:tetratricopeptide (TPR) repeat protein